MQSIFHASKHLKERRLLRKTQTKAEKVFWQIARNNKMKLKFRRQVSIGPFIVDFYCHVARLVIEIDGPVHNEQKEYDAGRQLWLEQHGFRVVRYTNDQVLFERDGVIETILSFASRSSPQPSPKGEGGDKGEGDGVV